MTLTIKRIIYTTLLPLLIGNAAYAQESGESSELNEFLDLLAQQTTLATSTRLNADYVPGMFSVIEHEQLQRRGFRTLWEALAAVPGVITTQNETGMRSISIRGIGELFEPSKVKLLLNGKSLNASASATTGTLYNTPVEQIERIEFIRGPGSAIHGEFAYAGVVNVITRNQGEHYGVGVESGEGVSFSLLRSYISDQGDFKASINLAANQQEGEDIDSGLDRSPTGIPSYAPGPINNKTDFVSAIVGFEFGETRTLLQFQQGNRGDHFGTNNLLPPDKRQTVISDTVLSAAVSRDFVVDDRLSGGWSINLLQNETEQNELFLGVAEAFGGFGFEDDIIADSLLEERRIEGKFNLRYHSGAHKLFAELTVTDIEVTESEQFINLDPDTNLPSPTLNEFPGPVEDGADRGAVSLALQDEYAIDERLTLTTGLRYDSYDDIDDSISPRIALVWRQTENRIFKAQLARAFRPPSLIEEGGSLESSIDPEVNDTLEFGYIYNTADLVIRNTIYFSKLDQLILFQDFAPFGYRNSGSFDLRGYELELEKSVLERWDFFGSLSLQDYSDDELPGAAPWIVKLGISHQVLPLTELNLQIDSIGSRERHADDPRSDFEQTNQVDLTVRRQNFMDIGGLDFRVGIRNLLDDTLKHPAPTDTYPDDYPYSDGATLWAQILYRP